MTRRSTAVALLASLVLAGAVSVANADGRHDNTGTLETGLYRNHSAAFWAWKFRRRTRQLQAARAAVREVIRRPVYGKSQLESAFLCIHRYEGSWWDTGSPFWGGLQMDWSFMNTYAPWAVSAFGTADQWPISVQIATAIRAYVSGRGFHPWPNTARVCGLL